jgi:glycosyltransferase involved in cell wall biosynthesis
VELVPQAALATGRLALAASCSAQNGQSQPTRILFRAPLNAYTGYGLHACEIASFLIRQGYRLQLRATNLNEAFAPLPNEIRKHISAREIDADWELVLHPPGHVPLPNRRTVFFTMWESTRLPESAVANLNAAEMVIVPSAWNASCFSAQGVTRHIKVVPLGIDTSVFSYRPTSVDGPCVFGAAGRLESGGTRKGLNQVISLFSRAFPDQRDVRLHVKAFPDCPIDAVDDDRVLITREYYTPQQLSNWFSSITCFVSAARAEGWGLMQHQALAVGRPLISVCFGGVAEYFTSDMGYFVNYNLTPGTGLYQNCGVWAEPDEDCMIELMRQVYRNRDEAKRKGEFAAQRLCQHTWNRSNEMLLKLLKNAGLVS